MMCLWCYDVIHDLFFDVIRVLGVICGSRARGAICVLCFGRRIRKKRPMGRRYSTGIIYILIFMTQNWHFIYILFFNQFTVMHFTVLVCNKMTFLYEMCDINVILVRFGSSIWPSCANSAGIRPTSPRLPRPRSAEWFKTGNREVWHFNIYILYTHKYSKVHALQ